MASKSKKAKDGDRPVYLVVADETEEFESALRYAARAARANGANLAVLHVIDEQSFVHWGAIEKQMRLDQRQAAEAFLLGVAEKIYDFSNLICGFYIEQGQGKDAVSEVLKANPEITKIILGGNTHSSSPGPLVSYFTGKGMSHLPVPLTIVPGHLDIAKIDEFV